MITKTKTLTQELLRQMDSYWRASNYLSVGKSDLYDDPRLLQLAHIKPRLFGHQGKTAGLNFVYGFTRIAGRESGPTASSRNRPL